MEWIACSERVPEIDRPVWLWCERHELCFIGVFTDFGSGQEFANCHGDFYWDGVAGWEPGSCKQLNDENDDWRFVVTHWAPLPPPPNL